MTPVTLLKAQQYLQVLEIEASIYASSVDFTPDQRDMLLRSIAQVRDITETSIRNDDLDSAGLRSLVDPTLCYWNGSITMDTEVFWRRLREAGIPYQRKEPLRFVLKHGRFPDMTTARGARTHWPALLASGMLHERYSVAELDRIAKLIDEDEASRLQLLRDCLRKGRLPGSQYLRFGSCIAYFTNLRLLGDRAWVNTPLEGYFSEAEIAELDRIWGAAG